MTANTFFCLLTGGVLLVSIAALGVRLIQEVAWHDLKEYSKRRDRRDRFDEIHDDHDRLLVGLETLRTVGFVVVIIGACGWMAMSVGVSGNGPPVISLVVWLSITLLAVSSWIPPAVTEVWGSALLFHCWRIFRAASFCVLPLSAVAGGFEVVARRLSGTRDDQDEEEAFEDEVLAIVTEGLHDGHLEADAREMIEGVIELGDGDVADVMTPRSKIDALSVDDDWDTILTSTSRAGRTRMPVYDQNLDNIVGILYIKDLLVEMSQPASQRRSLRDLLRNAWQVPKTRKLDGLLQDFLNTRNHMAIVVDEYTALAGLVTIEDVLEEIVGEIVDESDKEQLGEIRRVNARTAEIQGRAHLAEINEELGLELPEPDDFDTIAGFVIDQLGRIPKTGEVLQWRSIRLTVLAATRRKVERVQLESLDAPLVQQVS